jgi:hypothetical protein
MSVLLDAADLLARATCTNKYRQAQRVLEAAAKVDKDKAYSKIHDWYCGKPEGMDESPVDNAAIYLSVRALLAALPDRAKE